MIDISQILKVFKGKDAENFKAVVTAYKDLFDEMRLDVNQLRKENAELKVLLNESLAQMKKVMEMEEKCLERNVKSNELVRNLAEWIIFTERRPEVSESIGKLLK